MKSGTSVARVDVRKPGLPTMVLTLFLAAVLPLAALIDQLGTGTLDEYSNSMYAAHGVDTSPGALYVLVYIGAGIGIALWFVAFMAVAKRRKWASFSVVASIVFGVFLAATLFFASEYGQHIFPPVWGVFASLGPIAGIFALAISTSRDRTTHGS